MDFFENYAFVAMQNDNANLYACKIIIRLQFEENIFFARWRHHPQNTAEIFFSNTNSFTTLKPPGGSREAKLSIEFEFGSLVR